MGRTPSGYVRGVEEIAGIRTARVDEGRALEWLERRASRGSGAVRRGLPDRVFAVPVAQLRAGIVRVAESEAGELLGFSLLLGPHHGVCELDGLFVDPDAQGAGVGRLLIVDARAEAVRRGAARIEVVSASESVGFYARMGFKGRRTVPTRYGPAVRMGLDIDDASALLRREVRLAAPARPAARRARRGGTPAPDRRAAEA
ncbi:GNAT family N-acetyltransferase [Patulibacter sp. SYSU D01012]|uniref:GNAT family N-acetyltransferase n=1 Tax=Patulibacter sp. SYSU D01012 TaxID=2817381 RepID=UPI001B318768|nr:GNAT family N-acetyltransferase [Patulibacter sp. SYSU D01012]